MGLKDRKQTKISINYSKGDNIKIMKLYDSC